MGREYGECQVVRLERWPRARLRRTWLAMDFVLCMNGSGWKVLNKGMKQSSLLFSQFIGCCVRSGMERPGVEAETSWGALQCYRCRLYGSGEEQRNRKHVWIIPHWCSI